MLLRAATAQSLALLVLLLPRVVECKLHSGTLEFGGAQGDQQWHFLGKFGYAIGTGRYDVRLRLRQELGEEDDLPRPDLEVFLDEDWPRADGLAACRRALEVPARRSHSRIVPGEFGEWGRWHSGALFQKVRPHIWYFALSDCRDQYAGGIADASQRASYSIDYEIRWTQFDDSELSLEMRYMPAASWCAITVLTILGFRLAFKCHSTSKSAGRLHPAIPGLAAAITLQWASQMLHLLHLRTYMQDGVGIHAADMLAEVLFELSQVAGASLLIALAQGYTLVRSKLRDLQLAPVVATVAMLQVLLAAVGKLQGESSCKYHESEGMVGWIMLFLRMSLLAWFRSSLEALSSKGGARAAYFLAFPAVFLFVQVLAPYLQQPVLETCMLSVQTTSLLWLADLFLARRGVYFEASELSASLLPGGAGAHCYSPSWQKKDM
eukprot:TRINITY_DN12367_c0_g1_i4.p1 TRINITY_DN12367_c0_g1~~TRINITY_DN12367_c0_g1_i4.p1  ORF type:complete len:447 (-),score=94.25 TRINITY_DN12367_c0_g1_i4:169-1476(-)